MDVKENNRSRGYIVKILEFLICDNLEFNPFERYLIYTSEKGKKNVKKKAKRFYKH